jgi:hypothetical protein
VGADVINKIESNLLSYEDAQAHSIFDRVPNNCAEAQGRRAPAWASKVGAQRRSPVRTNCRSRTAMLRQLESAEALRKGTGNAG